MDSDFSENQVMEGRWEQDEHLRFLHAIVQKGKSWKFIEKAVETRSGSQVRSHAQKFFLKLDKLCFQRTKNVSKYNWQLLDTEREIQNLFTQKDITQKTPFEISIIIKKDWTSYDPEMKKKKSKNKNVKNLIKTKIDEEEDFFKTCQKRESKEEKNSCFAKNETKNNSFFGKLLQQKFTKTKQHESLIRMELESHEKKVLNENTVRKVSFVLPDNQQNSEKLQERRNMFRMVKSNEKK